MCNIRQYTRQGAYILNGMKKIICVLLNLWGTKKKDETDVRFFYYFNIYIFFLRRRPKLAKWTTCKAILEDIKLF
jgi:hypothetical protein